MSSLEIVIKWVKTLRFKIDRPKAYYFRDGRPTKQLTLAEMRFHVSTGNIVDKKVVEWVNARAAETEMPELEEVEEKAKPETLEDKEGFAPNSRELYEYLESLYSKSVRPLGSGSYRDLVDKSSNSKRIADY
jgi:hypothetical protein